MHAPSERRTVYVALRDPEGMLIHDESILSDGRVVGRMTSGSYGYTIGRACGIGYVMSDTPKTATSPSIAAVANTRQIYQRSRSTTPPTAA